MSDASNEQPIVDIFGEVLFDCFPGGRRVLGGAPFNVAWHLRAFGAAPRLISAVGDDPQGEQVRRAMQDWGMDTSSLQTDPDHATGEVRVMLEDGEPTYEIIPDRAFDHIRADDLPPAGELLYHGTLALRRPVSAATLNALKGRGHGIRFLDVNLRDPWWSLDVTRGLLQDADWVKLNRSELVLLSDGSGSNDADADADDGQLTALASAFLAQHGLTGLVVTLGGDGAFALGRETAPVRVAPAPALAVKDTVGAGDAFASVLILGIIRGWPLATTLERAQSFASRIVEQHGATAADPALYGPYLNQWGI
ncbi:PfkB family carbohydrate kinase [Thiocapsa roseopersicina]|uniref:Fructokinase n=1 Tax=Thiocapsa roseopersicina TaxID=1058 RepID=A0A1H2RJ69_THIRO|nr:PfkB family carbohydrate kinase [Thiocapsa roseopersicina]SDW18824.1 fructokinase [Thiocapsa roseopersicina]